MIPFANVAPGAFICLPAMPSKRVYNPQQSKMKIEQNYLRKSIFHLIKNIYLSSIQDLFTYDYE